MKKEYNISAPVTQITNLRACITCFRWLQNSLRSNSWSHFSSLCKQAL